MELNNSDTKNQNSLGMSLIRTITDSDIRDSAIDGLEVGIDQLFSANGIQDELLKEIPVLKTFYAIAKSGIMIRDHLFLRKLHLFLLDFKDIDDKTKNKLEQAKSDKKYQQEVGEHLVNSLERFDQLVKASSLFKIFIARIREEINHQEFLRYLYVLDKIDIHNINLLQEFYSIGRERFYSLNPIRIINPELNNFAFVGLLTLVTGAGLTTFDTNNFGEQFLQVLDLLPSRTRS
jgi:hypothetical protein